MTKHHTEQTASAHTAPTGHASLRSYAIGYILSIALTLEAFVIVRNHTFSVGVAAIVILALAIVQLLVQLFFFLHLDKAFKAPWNIIVFSFMALVVSIVVFGSLWIMSNLDYHMTSPAELDKKIMQDEALSKEK